MARVKKDRFLTPIPKPEFKDVIPSYKSSKTPSRRYDCNRCHGSGRVVADDAYRDPVEGYKLARRVDCSVCEGKGHLSRSYYQKILKKKVEEWKRKEVKRKEVQRNVRNVLKRISQEDYEILEDFCSSSGEYPSERELWFLTKDG